MQFKIASLVSLLFLGLVAADELKIEKTLEIPCGMQLLKTSCFVLVVSNRALR